MFKFSLASALAVRKHGAVPGLTGAIHASSTTWWRGVCSSTPSHLKPLPREARAVIIGGGVIGSSVAYHLSELGWQDIVLLEQGQLTCGTTWHAAGLIGQLRQTETETRLSKYGSQLYAELESLTGHATGWKQCGSLTVARNQDRMHNLQVSCSRARSFGIEAHLVSPDECARLWPLMKVDDLVGALWLPGDGTANASDVSAALAAGAKQRGTRILEQTRCVGVEHRADGRVSAVNVERRRAGETEPERQRIACEVVVNCAGMWAREEGRRAGVSVPLQAAEHFYVVTEPMEGVSADTPVMRDPDGWTYYREWSGGLILGGFEPNAKPCFPGGRIPDRFEFQLFDEDWDHFSILMENGLLRVPSLESATIRQMVNGPESFTIDNQYILGEAPELANYYVAAGFNSSGIASAGGAGKALSEWIHLGRSPIDLWTVDIRRFGAFQANPNFLTDRTKETLGLHYAMGWPRREVESARPLRVSPLYERLKQRRAVFGSKMGWERVNYFAKEDQPTKMSYSFSKPAWLPNVIEEHRACRESAALFDQTSFSKFLVQGRDVEKALQRICANDVAVEPGAVVYTAMLNERGGFESDLTVTRLAADQFMVVSPTAQTTRDFHWIKNHFADDEHVTITDVTSSYAVLGLMGPKSRTILQELSTADLSNDAFPFSTSQTIDVGLATVRAQRLTYVGELGWELYISVEMALHVFDQLHKAGDKHGLRDAGYFAIESLRIEKGYRAWGPDLTADYSPLEAGLSFAVDLNKPDFIGRSALMEQKAQGTLKRRMVLFRIDDSEAFPHGNEPIYMNGELAGYLSSATFTGTLGCGVGMGYVNSTEKITKKALEEANFEVEIASRRYPVTASFSAFHDPKSTAIRA